MVKINDSGEEIWRTTVGGSRTDIRDQCFTTITFYISGITNSDDFAENKDDNLWQNYVAQIDNSGFMGYQSNRIQSVKKL